MRLSKERLLKEAAATGFRPESLEKVIQLVGLLNALQRHTYLRDRLALKGGTALNLFVFELPRLSVDIDLNYIGAVAREVMMEERPQLEAALAEVFDQEGFTVRKVPTDHAGGKWQLRYAGALGGGAGRISKWISTTCSGNRSGRCGARPPTQLGLSGPRTSRCWTCMNWRRAN